MKKIKIQDEFKDDFISRAAGESLRHKILAALEKANAVEIDFQNTQVASLSFFDESIAKLLDEGFSKEDIQSKLRLVNMSRFDKEILDQLLNLKK